MKKSQVGAIGRKVIIGFAALLVVVAVALAIVSKNGGSSNQNASVDTSGARTAADTFLKEVAQNNADDTWNMMTDRYHATIGAKADWQSLVSASSKASSTTPQFVKIENMSGTHDAYKNQNPQVATYISTIKGVKWSTIVYVLYVNNTWKIEGMDSSPS